LQEFGSVAVGAQSPSVGIRVVNAGLAPTDPLATALTGAIASFGVQADRCAGQALDPGASCSVDVRFAPAVAGPLSGTLTVGGGSATIAIALHGNGGGASSAALAWSPATGDFGTVSTASAARQTFTLTNGSAAATPPVTVTSTGPDAAVFALSSDTCTGQALGAGKSCTVVATFRPKAAGPKTASLVAKAGSATAQATLIGTGAIPAGLSFSSTQPFGRTATGQSVSQTLTLSNGGTTATAVPLVLAVGGADPAAAAMYTLSSDGCSGKPLGAGATCAVDVAFAPTSPGTKTATLTAAASALTATATLTGTAVAPAAIAFSTVPPFGSVLLGQTKSQTVTLTNGGGTPTPSVTLAVSSTDPAAAAMFAITSDACSGKALGASGGNCSVTIVFQPTTSGPETATLTATAGSATTTAMLTGIGASAAQLAVTGTTAFDAPIGPRWSPTGAAGRSWPGSAGPARAASPSRSRRRGPRRGPRR
jgi:hypothetical protein